jgi:arylsulfatase A-like enzyme
VYDQDQPVTEMKYLTDQLTDEALEFVRQSAQARKPFFLFLSYSAPHGPLQPRPDTLEEYERMPANEQGRTLTRALIDGLDSNVGRVLRELFLSRLETNTIVIFASDNGGNEYESPEGAIRSVGHNGGLRGTKFTTWEGGIRVPLIIRWPGRLPANLNFTKPVHLVDLYPTAAAAAGIEIPTTQPLDGVNLLPYITGENPGTPHDLIYACNGRNSPQWSIRKGDWKLVKDYPDTSFFRARPRPETTLGLYDLGSPIPKERENLLTGKPDIAEELRALYDGFMASCPPGLKGPDDEDRPRKPRKTKQ